MQKKICGWLRARDEIKTIQHCLKSTENVFDRFIITCNDCTDGTDKLLEDWVRDRKEYTLYKYPHSVFGIGNKIYKDGGYKFKNSLAGLYNFALDKVNTEEYLFKIDGDTIYDREELLNIIGYIKKDSYKKNMVYFYKMYNLLMPPDNKIYINKKYPYKGLLGDHYYCQRLLVKGFEQIGGSERISFTEKYDHIHFKNVVGINIEDKPFNIVNNWDEVMDENIKDFIKKLMQ